MNARSEAFAQSHPDLGRYEVLLQMADLMVHYTSLDDLLRELAVRLHEVVVFEFASFSLYDPERKMMQFNILEGKCQPLAPQYRGLEESASGWVWQRQEPLVIQDLAQESRFPRGLHTARELGMRSYCLLPLTTAQRRLGALGLGTARVGAYTEHDLQFLLRVAALVAVAIEGTLTRKALQEEKERLQTIIEINQNLVSSLELASLFPKIADSIGRLVPHEFASIALFDEGLQGMRAWVLASPDGQEIMVPGETVPMEQSLMGQAFREREPKNFSHDDIAQSKSVFSVRMMERGLQSLCCVPLRTSTGVFGTLNVGSTREQAFSEQDQSLLEQVASQVAIALDNARAYHEIAELKDRVREEKLYLEDEIRSELGFEEIIGESPALKRVLAQVKVVADSGATVLILGETGTGKELIARAIHRMSGRRENSFIKINCAAIPTGLLESELFGHEKGAFTGAISQKVGRLELANGGTFFLDEVGDIPLELQPKLLRVLQDQEFERLGSAKTIRVNLRLIAATNRDLAKSVAERQFRSDLYYRLRVFPIHVPPLRERQEDIPLLVRYFVQKFARKMNKQIDTIPTETMKALIHWDWPGNVRELENFMERSVILTVGSVLRVPLTELQTEDQEAEKEVETLKAAERDLIVRTLRETHGTLAGPHGAAAKLGLKRTTLQSKITRLKILPQEYR